MSNGSFAMFEDCTIQFYDGDTPAHTLTIDSRDAGQEFPKGVVVVKTRRAVYDGNDFHNMKRDQDEVTFPEIELTGTVFDEDFSGTGTNARYVIEQWFANKKAWDGSSAFEDLVTTNDGNENFIKSTDFTIGMKVTFDNGETNKKTGYDYKYVEILDKFAWVDDVDLKFKFAVRIVTSQANVVYIAPAA